MAKRVKWRTFWCVVLSNGTALLSTAREAKKRSIEAYLTEVRYKRKDWKWWRRNGVACQRVQIAVKDA